MGASSLKAVPRPRVWNLVQQRFKESLHDENDLEICMETFSLDILLSQLKSVAEAHRNENILLASLSRFRPSLVYLNDFMTVLVLSFSLDVKTGALLWGGICLLLSLLAPLEEIFSEVQAMLEELIAALPGIHPFEDNVILDEKLETAMVELYTELAVFSARAISFIRVRRQHLLPIRQSWPQFSREFQHVLKRIQMLSQQVDRETQRAATTAALKWNNEMITLFQSLNTGHKDAGPELPCFHVPLTLNDRFYVREDLLDQIADTLSPKAGRSGPRTLALYGIGGAGKTQTALQYAYRARDHYDAVLWISADSTVKMAQDYMTVARRLGVVPATQETQDAFGAMAKMKSWLADTTCSWLLIFDNADNLEVLDYGWPHGVVGSILITTRDFNASLHPASQGIYVNVFDTRMGTEALQRLLGPIYHDTNNTPLVSELNKTLGGLPLALNQISSYIRQQKMSIKDFLVLYQNNRDKLHKRRPAAFDYQHTIGTVWKLALEKLTGNAAVLQRLLAFLDPEAIDETTLCNAASALSNQTPFNNSSLMFLSDPIDFEDAKAELLRAALIDLQVDLRENTKALENLKKALEIRESTLPPTDWGIGVSISNVGLAYTEQGDLPQAMTYLQRSLDFRKATNCRMVDNSYANIASCLLRMGKPREAEAMYTSVPDVRDLTDEQLLRESLPRYASGMQLLSMVRQAEGQLDEALDFASKVLQFRRQKFGARFKTCDSLCHVAKLMVLTKKSMAALQLLDECISIASSLPKAEGYLALAYFRKYQIYKAEGHVYAADCLRDAIRTKEVVAGRLGSDYDPTLADDDEAAYTQLVAWLLW
ncbi:hypothetical protein APSETT444_010771 [Aspergillus pseudonomiae]